MDSTGKRIKKKREALGITQDDLAQQMGKSSKQTVSSWENDKNEPTLTDFKKLAEILQTSVAYLIGETSNMEEPDSNMMYISKDEFIELQRMALRKEKDAVQELEKKLNLLANDKGNSNK